MKILNQYLDLNPSMDIQIFLFFLETMDAALKQQILQHLQTIPKGKVTTYKNIAKLFNIHPRAVASVMRYNADPITYPCYKVIAASGKISGYNTKI